jgi:hypothetical protein
MVIEGSCGIITLNRGRMSCGVSVLAAYHLAASPPERELPAIEVGAYHVEV